jgi:hypothetical protein
MTAIDPVGGASAGQVVSVAVNVFSKLGNWLARLIGINAAPHLVVEQPIAGGLRDDMRPSYQGSRYVVVKCVNRQRRDWRSRLRRTDDAIDCRGKIAVIDASGREIMVDDGLLCGPAGRRPTSTETLRLEDDRFHVPLLAHADDWIPHHTVDGRRLQPGTYLLGSRYFSGLHDAMRLPVGDYRLRVTMQCANCEAPEVLTSSQISVAVCDPLERDIIFSTPDTSVDADNQEWAQCCRKVVTSVSWPQCRSATALNTGGRV